MMQMKNSLFAVLVASVLAGCPAPGPTDAGDAALQNDVVAEIATDTGIRADVRPDARDAGVDAGPTPAGRECTDDSMCSPGSGYICDMTTYPRFRTGICTHDCEPNPTQSMEQSQCGGRTTTCLHFAPGSTVERAQCGRACPLTGTTSGCTASQICTTFLLFTGGPDNPAACTPFCHSDAQCETGTHCDRQGRCRTQPVNTALSPDGAPCNSMTDASPSTQCRGTCFRAGPNANQGICGGYVDIRSPPFMNPEGSAGICYDNDPAVVPRGASGDNMFRCLWRTCFCGAECPTGLICSQVGDDPANGGVCTYRNVAAMPPQVLLNACPDAGVDGGATDATTDMGTPDMGTPDAGTPDAGTPDAGTPDVGVPDVEVPDVLGDALVLPIG